MDLRRYVFVRKFPMVYLASRQIPSPSLRVLIALWRYHKMPRNKGSDVFWATYNSLVRDTGKSRTCIGRALKKLSKELGVIEIVREGKKGKKSLYRFPREYPACLSEDVERWGDSKFVVAYIPMFYVAAGKPAPGGAFVSDPELRILLVHLRKHYMAGSGPYWLSARDMREQTGLGSMKLREDGSPIVKRVRGLNNSIVEDRRLVRRLTPKDENTGRKNAWALAEVPAWLAPLAEEWVRSDWQSNPPEDWVQRPSERARLRSWVEKDPVYFNVLDVLGYWVAEYLKRFGEEDPDLFPCDDHAFDRAVLRLREYASMLTPTASDVYKVLYWAGLDMKEDIDLILRDAGRLGYPVSLFHFFTPGSGDKLRALRAGRSPPGSP